MAQNASRSKQSRVESNHQSTLLPASDRSTIAAWPQPGEGRRDGRQAREGGGTANPWPLPGAPPPHRRSTSTTPSGPSTASASPRESRQASTSTPRASCARSRRRGSTWRLRLTRPPRTSPRSFLTSWSSSPCSSPKYLLILDRTNWKTNMLTGLLVPYIFFTLPGVLFSLIRGEVGQWIGIIAIILCLFFPRHFPDWLELPGALILLILVAPSLFADTLRGDFVGIFICLIIGCYLLQEHIRASNGFRNAYKKGNGVSNTIGICLLFIYPVWALVLKFL